jgi:Heterokaryon incompatibility protein (HET)
MDDYQYQTLPSGGHHIRLVKLDEGEKTGEITCSVIQCPISAAPEYEAVSYCWGSPLEKTQVTCDGKALHVPLSLRPFLLRTRAKGRQRTLWIDSICVNQADDGEKASQVREMHQVYRKASRTLIWLGQDSETSTLGIQFALWLYKLALASEAEKKTWRYWWGKNWECYGIFLRQWAAFFELFERPWFSRAWTVQEAVLSSNAWITCGDNAIPWSALVGALLFAFTDQSWIFEFYGTTKMNNVLWLYHSQAEVAKGEKRFHYEILTRHRQNIAFDDRDTVFAFRGLSGHASFEEHNVIPNYKHDAETLFTELAVTTLSQASNLDFLSIPRLQSPSDPLNIPSWVPDWSCRSPLCCSFLQLELGGATKRQLSSYDATKGSLYHPIIDDETKRVKTPLHLLGYTVGRITNMSECWDLQDTKGFQSIRKQAIVLQKNQVLVNNWRSVALPDILSEDAPYVTGEPLYDVMWQTCVAGIFAKGNKEATAKMYSRFESRQRILRIIPWLGIQDCVWPWVLVVFVGHLLRLLRISNPEMEFRTSVSFMINRKLFKTDNGYMGMGPAIAEIGDYVVLVKGGRMPLAVRPRGRLWELMGDVYLHGAMGGELWKEEKCHLMLFR